MPIYKKKEKTKDGRIYYYQVNFTDNRGEYKRKTSKLYKTKNEALKAEAEFRASNGEIVSFSMTLSELFPFFFEDKKTKIKIQSHSRIINQFNYINQFMGDLRMDKITIVQYQRFKNELNNVISQGHPLSTTYKNKIHQLVKSMFSYARLFYGMHNTVPELVGGFSNPNEIKKEMDFYTLDEYKLFRSHIAGPIYTAFFDLLYYCGLRQGEANALSWKDVDFDKNTISINKTVTSKIKGKPWHISAPKTKSSIRTLPIPNVVLNGLIDIKKHYVNYIDFCDEWFVFGGHRPLPETTIQVNKNKIAKHSNLKQIRIHDFRHSCASLLINNGANITVVAKFLGHTKIDMTLNTYSHMYKSKLEEIVSLINDM